VATHQVAYTVVHNLLFAPAVIEAQRLLATEYPDLAIVDLGLPDRDGLRAAADGP